MRFGRRVSEPSEPNEPSFRFFVLNLSYGEKPNSWVTSFTYVTASCWDFNPMPNQAHAPPVPRL